MLKKIVIAAVAVAALGSTNGFAAGTATIALNSGNLAVSATVVPSCTASQGSPVAFGNVNNSPSTINQQGTVQVTCDSGIDFAVGLGLGGNSIGSQRRMLQSVFKSGAFTNYYIPYELYADAGYTTPIVDIAVGAGGSTTGVSTAATPGGTGTGLAQTITIYGQIPANIQAFPGTYNDNVSITIGY